MTARLLKLQAKDAEDTQVVSAILQDALVPVCDMAYIAEQKNFVMVVHRLIREHESAEGPLRICCAVNLGGVDKTQISGIDLSRSGRILELLAVLTEPGQMTFIFAGEAKIRLQLSDWSMIVEDFGESWPAQCTPCHEQTGTA